MYICHISKCDFCISAVYPAAKTVYLIDIQKALMIA